MTYYERDDGSAYYFHDEKRQCVFGDACLCPHYDHGSDECFTAEMAETERHMLECDADHEHKPDTCCSCRGPHDS